MSIYNKLDLTGWKPRQLTSQEVRFATWIAFFAWVFAVYDFILFGTLLPEIGRHFGWGEVEQAEIATWVAVGTAVVAFAIGPVVDKLGRRKGIIFTVAGSRVRLSGQAGGADLFLKIKVLPHSVFTRKGDDLTATVPVDLYTAILGGEVSVDTLGKPVRLTIPEGTDSGKTMRLKGLGMPNLKKPTEFGDLYARIEVHLPGHLTPAEKEKFREIRNMRHA